MLRYYLLLLPLLPLLCFGGEFNDQVMGRVSERLADFMGVPVDATQRTSNYRRIGGFPNDMAPFDRNLAMTHLYSEVDVKVYYGLEDGTFVIYSDSPSDPYVSFRSPGESGFDISDGVPAEMQKHFSLCINLDTGEPEDCIQSEGSPYIDCREQGNCTAVLEKCPNGASQTDCSVLPVENQTDCESNIKWCPQYDVLEVQAGEKRGFVPRVYACINAMGQLEETPGRVVKNELTGELGSCYFRDGTETTRIVEGEYAFCGSAVTTCDDAFVGVFRSRDYDPRFRSWYRLCKEKQTVIWSDPYPFFSTLAIGMTLNRPLYSIEDGKNIFQGVLAVDYSLERIASFLAEQYQDSEINVLIVEDGEPNYVVAASTGTPSANLVSKEDETQPCPVENNQDQFCNVVRVSIDKLEGVHADKVLVAAFNAQLAGGWPRNELVSVKIASKPGAAAYVSQSELFEQKDANLKWRVIVTMPIELSTVDAALRGDNVFAIVCLLGGLGFFVCMLLFLVFFSKRHEPAVIHADWRFTCAFILGCAGINLSTFTMLGENKDGLCMLRMWSFNLLFACGMLALS